MKWTDIVKLKTLIVIFKASEYTLLEKRVFYTTEKEFSNCPCIRTLIEH